jgi:hypothetical protein
MGDQSSKLHSLTMDIDRPLPANLWVDGEIRVSLNIQNKGEWERFNKTIDLRSFTVSAILERNTFTFDFGLNIDTVINNGAIASLEFLGSLEEIRLATNISDDILFEKAIEHETTLRFDYSQYPKIHTVRFQGIPSEPYPNTVTTLYTDHVSEDSVYYGLTNITAKRANGLTYDQLYKLYQKGLRYLKLDEAMSLEIEDPHVLGKDMPDMILKVGEKAYYGKNKLPLFELA